MTDDSSGELDSVGWGHEQMLTALDAKGYGKHLLNAINFVRDPRQVSRANPRLFVCSDKKQCWVKPKADQGFAKELIAGRLAHKLKIGPMAYVVRVTDAAYDSEEARRDVGLFVGSEDKAKTENTRYLAELASTLPDFKMPNVSFTDWTGATVFHAWIQAGDRQLLLGMTDGHIWSCDHEECFTATGGAVAFNFQVVPIHGLEIALAKNRVGALDMATKIASLSDTDILQAVSQMPDEAGWLASFSTRLAIAKSLMAAKGTLRMKVEEWLR